MRTAGEGAVDLDADLGAAASTLERLLRLADSSSMVSMAMARDGGRTWLLICGATSPRRDMNGRSIGNTVAWSAERAAEPGLVKIAAAYLLDPDAFGQRLAGVTRESQDRPEGWAVDARALYGIAGEQPDVVAEPGRGADPGGRYAGYDPDTTKQLAAELTAAGLPPRDGLLVLVTAFHTPEAFADLDIWRGITARSEIAPQWRPLPPRMAETPKPPRSALTILAAAIAVVMALAVWIAFGHFR